MNGLHTSCYNGSLGSIPKNCRMHDLNPNTGGFLIDGCWHNVCKPSISQSESGSQYCLDNTPCMIDDPHQIAAH